PRGASRTRPAPPRERTARLAPPRRRGDMGVGRRAAHARRDPQPRARDGERVGEGANRARPGIPSLNVPRALSAYCDTQIASGGGEIRTAPTPDDEESDKGP